MSNKKINRRNFMKLSLAGAVFASGGCSNARDIYQVSKEEKKPNILLIITDQQNYETISACGNEYLHTPNLDRLYNRGSCFSQAYTSHPLCLPARSSIFTGRMPVETGCWINHTKVCADGIRQSIPTMGEWFSEKGNYESVYAGKWHCPEPYTYDIRGFRVISSGLDWQGDVSDGIVSRACEDFLLSRSNQNPFLLVASLHQPHDICNWVRFNIESRSTLKYPSIKDELPPLPTNFLEVENEPKDVKLCRYVDWSKIHWQYYLWSYYKHVEMVDAEIGRILRALDNTGQTENTIIVFVSDHGEGCAHHKMVKKGWLYDESVKVPLMFSLPGVIAEKHIDNKSLVSVMDIMPTLCELAELPVPPDIKGSSLKSALLNKAHLGREYLVSETVARKGYSSKSALDTARMVRSKQYKYIKYNGDPVVQLFDMQNDPLETNNLAGQSLYADKIREHEKLLSQWENSLSIDKRVKKNGYPWS
jgi:choline-sulfatase